MSRSITRRQVVYDLGLGAFVVGAGLGAVACAGPPRPAPPTPTREDVVTEQRARVAFVRTTDRADGVRRALQILGPVAIRGKHVFLKPNLNSADPAPGSTHPTTLRTFVDWLLAQGAAKLTIGDRSGMGNTHEVMRQTGVLDLGRELGIAVVALDELDAGSWVKVQPPGSHWSQGFMVPRLLSEVDAIVQICNLKTHRFGGHFTLSLKNAVGLAAKVVPSQPHDYMSELHSSPHQREMIAEINVAYRPALILLDGVEAFVTGGPDRGERAPTEVVLAGTDRVAIDAVGVALLRLWGTTTEVKTGPIFGQAQIRRAVELGLGVRSPAEIELVTEDEASRSYAAQVRAVLDAG